MLIYKIDQHGFWATRITMERLTLIGVRVKPGEAHDTIEKGKAIDHVYDDHSMLTSYKRNWNDRGVSK